MKDNDLYPVLFALCLIFVVPLVIGIFIFFCVVMPFSKYLEDSYYKTYFIYGSAGFVGISIIILFLFGFDYGLFQSHFSYLINSFLSGFISSPRVVNFMSIIGATSAPFGLVIGFLVIPKIHKAKFKNMVSQEKKTKKTHISKKKFLKSREDQNGLFVGYDQETKKPVHLSSNELSMHTQVIGTTGFGKTASVLLSRLNYEMRAGNGLIFIDGKGDIESFFQFKALVKEIGREDDLMVFSPMFIEQSHKYNPLIRGSSTEIKDRLIGSQIWSEEFYKKKGEELILMICNVFSDLEITPSFRKIEEIFKNPKPDFLKGAEFKNSRIKERYQHYVNTYNKTEAKNFAGLASDISLLSESNFGTLFECEAGEGIDLLEAYQKHKIVYFHLPVLAFEETAKRMGRMIIHDLKTLCALIQTQVHPNKRDSFPVYIDEFASFASESFIELLNKARSAGMSFTVIHQSLGDIQKVSDNFSRQLFENTNVKMVLRVDDPETIETYCKMVGTRQNIKMTYQADNDAFRTQLTGGVSAREVDEFIVDPNEFRNLSVGEGIVMIKNTNRVHRVML